MQVRLILLTMWIVGLVPVTVLAVAATWTVDHDVSNRLAVTGCILGAIEAITGIAICVNWEHRNMRARFPEEKLFDD